MLEDNRTPGQLELGGKSVEYKLAIEMDRHHIVFEADLKMIPLPHRMISRSQRFPLFDSVGDNATRSQGRRVKF